MAQHKRERQTHAHIEVTSRPNRPGGKGIKVTTPDQALKIESKKELEAQLKHYNKPFVSHVVPDSPFARRNYVERIRPALRYYCAKYGIDVPKWLADDSHYLEMDAELQAKLFGTTALKVKEFRKMKFKKGKKRGSEN